MKTWTTLAICGAAMLSGGAALAYEVAWARALVVPLGNSADAASLVLSGFMLGIAVGARLGGGLAERVASPLRLYAGLELWLGLYALVAPWLFGLLSGIGSVSSPAAGVVARAFVGFVLVALPGLAMGATVPLLLRAVTGASAPLGVRIGILYGANTAGAAAGALLTGFWGFAAIGLRLCSAGAAATSLCAAAVAVAASFWAHMPAGEVSSDQGGVAHATRDTVLGFAALGGAFTAGFAMLACELVWARVLTFVFGHDTYAFASLLTFVLVGLGAGGFAHRLFARRDQARLFAVLFALFALFVLASFWVAASLVIRFGRDPFVLDASGLLATSIRLELYRELAYTPILVLSPAVIAGMLYPTACSLYGGDAADVGRKVGIVGLANGLGSGLGALAGAFGLVPLAGIQGALIGLALLGGVASCAVLLVTTRPLGLRPAARAMLPLAAVGLTVALMPAELPRRMLLSVVGARHWTLLHYEEARTGTVSVIQNQVNGEKQLLMNAVNEVTTRLVHDQSFKMLGHLAPLLHPHPKTALMICLGAGLSAGAAVTHPLERLDVVDLSPAVARGAGYFAVENNGVLESPIFHLHEGDGRQFLLNSNDRYDVAMIDSTHPKSVDSWILYTKEFYELLRDRLSSGGIAVQWLPLHGLSEREFKIIVRTFQSAFADMTMWANVGFETYGQTGYAKLVGVKDGPLVIDFDRLARRLAEPRIRQDLAPFGMERPEEVLDSFVAGPAAVAAWTDGLPLQTDDHPIIPFTTSFSTGRRMEPHLLLAVRSPVTPFLRGETWSEPAARKALGDAYEAQGLVIAGLLDRAAERRPEGGKIRLFVAQSRTAAGYYAALGERYAADPDMLFEIGTQLGSLGFPEMAEQIYDKALALRPGDFRIRLNLALLLGRLGQQRRAIELLVRLRSEQPQSAIVHHNLGALILAAGDPGTAAAHLKAALARDPQSIGARVLLAQAYLEEGQLDHGEAELAGLLEQNPWIAEAYDLLGRIATRRGDRPLAVERHAKAVSLNPHHARFQAHLGLALRQSGALEQAASAYQAALAIEPSSAVMLSDLGLVYAAQGQLEHAAELYLRALDIDPQDATAAYRLGLALRGQGRTPEAIGALCLALHLDPDLSPARAELIELGKRDGDCGD